MPQLVRMVRTSERSDFMQCRWKWDHSYVQQLRVRETGMNALIFGDMVHRALAAFYIPQKGRKLIRGPHPAETFEKICDSMERSQKDTPLRIIVEENEEKWITHRELGLAMMENYIQTYGMDERYRILYPEMPFQYVVRDKAGKYACTYVGTTDALARDQESGLLVLLEHKTAAAISFDHLFIDEQANTYWTIVPLWLLENGIVKDANSIDAMVYNFLRKHPGDERPKNAFGQYLNKDGSVSQRQPAPLFARLPLRRGVTERERCMERIIQQVGEMKMVRSGKLPTYKSPSKNCTFCQFKDLCEMDEIGNDTEDYKEYAFHPWSPYEQHIWSMDLA